MRRESATRASILSPLNRSANPLLRIFIGLVALGLLAQDSDVFRHDTLAPALDELPYGILTPGGALDSPSRTREPFDRRNVQPGQGDAMPFAVKPRAGVSPTQATLTKGSIQPNTVEAVDHNFVSIVASDRLKCSVDALPVEVKTQDFQVSWRAFGSVGELYSYTVLVSVDNEPFVPFLESTGDNRATFRGAFGHSYGFLCIATDTAGNVEAKSHVPDAMTIVRSRIIRDMDGDRKADMLWRHSSGILHTWFMNGLKIASAGSPGSVTTDWIVQGIDDFDGDDKADILWRHSSGLVAIWLMDGTSTIDAGFPAGVGIDWAIQGVGDFNGDGKADILWRHSSGATSIWLMDGTSIRSVGFPAGVGSDWTIQGVGDFNGDGKADILWRHSSGVLSIWLMDGTRISSVGSPGVVGTDWTIQGVGDFNGDGRADILWRHSSGGICVWLVDGTKRLRAGFPAGIGPEWTVQDTVDLDGDGNADIVWRHASGLVFIWLMDGTHIRSAGSPGAVALTWTMQ